MPAIILLLSAKRSGTHTFRRKYLDTHGEKIPNGLKRFRSNKKQGLYHSTQTWLLQSFIFEETCCEKTLSLFKDKYYLFLGQMSV